MLQHKLLIGIRFFKNPYLFNAQIQVMNEVFWDVMHLNITNSMSDRLSVNSANFEANDFSSTDNSSDFGQIRQYEPNLFDRANDYLSSPSFFPEEAVLKFGLRLMYNIADDLTIYTTSMMYGPSKARRLNNVGVNPSETTEAGLNTITNFFPLTSTTRVLKIGKSPLNASQFEVKFKGTSALRVPHQQRGVFIRQHNFAIRQNNSFGTVYPYFVVSPILLHPDNFK